MKKTKIEDRINSATEAFFAPFENEKNEFLVSADSDSMLRAETSAKIVTKIDGYYAGVKQLLLFLPGVFVLFQLTLSVFFFSLTFNLQILFWLLAGSFMTIAGIGDLKKLNSWLIPLSVILVAAVAAIPMNFMSEIGKQNYFLRYSIYLFPIALVLPYLVRNWISDK